MGGFPGWASVAASPGAVVASSLVMSSRLGRPCSEVITCRGEAEGEQRRPGQRRASSPRSATRSCGPASRGLRSSPTVLATAPTGRTTDHGESLRKPLASAKSTMVSALESHIARLRATVTRSSATFWLNPMVPRLALRSRATWGGRSAPRCGRPASGGRGVRGRGRRRRRRPDRRRSGRRRLGRW